jgi:hypothetical protein
MEKWFDKYQSKISIKIKCWDYQDYMDNVH